MKNLWAGIKLGFQTLVSNPIKYVLDPVGSTTEQYKKNLEAEGYGIAEIDQALKAYRESGGIVADIGEAYGGVTTGIGKAVKSLGNVVGFLGKNLTVVLVVALIIIALWYFLMFRKAAA